MNTVDLFESWRPRKDAVTAEKDWRRYCQYNERSVPLAFPNEEETIALKAIPLFGFTPASGSLSVEGKVDNREAHDIVLHVGGPVWGLDWCPATAQIDIPNRDTSATISYLAIGCHPLYAVSNQIGVPVSGPGVLQIWQIPQPDPLLSDAQLPKPRLVLGLINDGGLVWQCKWCPDPLLKDTAQSASSSETLPRLGLIAAALGDGSVRIWSVQQPAVILDADEDVDVDEEPPLAHQTPVAMLTRAHLGGSLPSTIDWLPSQPHDLLLVGCWDGSVAVVKLMPEKTDANSDGSIGCRILSHFPGDNVPLRAVKWVPPSVGLQSPVDVMHRNLFMTAGHEGTLKIWDRRDEFQPVYWQGISTSVILDATWTTEPFGVMSAMEDASVRAVLLGYKDILQQQGSRSSKPVHSCIWRGANTGAIWSIAAHPKTNEVAYSGEDGVLGYFKAEYWADNRKRSSHDALGGFKMENGVLHILASEDLAASSGLYVDRTVDRLQALAATLGILPDELQAIHRLAWNHTTPTCLASGGSSGLVRCQMVHSFS